MNNINVVEFIRVSTLEQAKDDRSGIPRQIEANRETIKRNNLNVIETFKLIDVSGASVTKTPEFNEIIGLIKSKKIQGIVISEWNRLIRMDKFEELSFLDILKEYNIKVYTFGNTKDLNEEGTDILSVLDSMMAGKERERMKKVIHQSKENRRKGGKHPNNDLSLPLGISYDRRNDRYEYNDKAYKIIILFELFVIEGIHNYTELGKKAVLHPRNVKNLLKNKLYIGIREYTQKRSDVIVFKKDGKQGDKAKIHRNQDEIIRSKVIQIPLIEEPIFNQAQEIIKNKNSEYDRKKSIAKEVFLYRGFLRCGNCGEKLYTSHGGKNNRDYYFCRTKKDSFIKTHGPSKCPSGYMKKSNVEYLLDSFIAEELSNDAYLSKLVKIAITPDNEQNVEQEIKTLNNSLKKINFERKKLLALYKDGVYEKEELYKEVVPLNDDRNQIESRIETLRKRTQSTNIKDIEKKITPLAITLNEFAYWNPKQKRDFLRTQFPEFYVTSTGITNCKLNFCNSGNRMDKG